jgi:hypothetical protein
MMMMIYIKKVAYYLLHNFFFQTSKEAYSILNDIVTA